MPAGRRRKASTEGGLTNVRDVASSFIGRESDLAALGERYDGGSRLVTLIGPGGMGKTRLAVRFARSRVEAYTAHGGGGVWLCDLTEARGVMGMATIVAATLGVRLPRSAREATVAEELAMAIARLGRVLLVFDGFEHLVGEGASAIEAWLGAAPRSRFLVTSRAPLDVAGEELWPLAPLAHDQAMELFLARTRQVRPHLDAGDTQRAIISTIVDSLDGMPLAIELAASRMAILSPEQLRDRLHRPLDLLAGRREVGRHTSVRRTVLDSVNLLPPAERSSFAACAVFRDGFTLEAAEAVIGAEGALGAIESLCRHSLLRATPSPELDGELRFSFFDTIREVASELLGADAGPAERHAAFYATLAEGLRSDAAIHSGGRAFLRLGRELGNLVQAHARAVVDCIRAGQGAHLAIVIALALDPVLSARGLSRLRLHLLDQAIDCARRAADPDPAELAETLLARGLATRELGDMEGAQAVLEEGLTLATQADRPDLAALAHARIGELIEVAGGTVEAHSRFVRSLSLLEQSPQSPIRSLREAEVSMGIAHAHRREGGLDKAESAVGAAIGRYRQLGHDEGLASALYEAAVIAMFQGRREIALARFDEGLRTAQRANARAIAGALTTARGGLLQEMGDLDQALAHHAEAARVFRELGSRYRETSALYYLATAYLERGDATEAERFLSRALELVSSVGSPRYQALIEGCRAIALARLGDFSLAADAMARAEKACARCATEPALRATLAIHRETLSMLVPRAASEGARGSRSLMERTEAEARALCDAHPSDDSRFALRILRSVVDPVPPQARVALLVWERAMAFRLPRSKEPVDLSRRAPLRRIVLLLTEERLQRPGQAVPVEDIVRAGWPGERMDAESALNRAYVALATLRKLGLRDLLVTGAGGYWLSPAVSLRVVTGDGEL